MVGISKELLIEENNLLKENNLKLTNENELLKSTLNIT